MRGLVTGLLIAGLAGCNVGHREVVLPTGADAWEEARREAGPLSLTADGQVVALDRGAKVAPPPAKGDVTTCVFMNSTDEGSCYTATNHPGPLAFECKGVGSCQVVVTAPLETELTWKSSCGGYAYSLVDGAPDSVGFACPGHDDPMEKVSCVFSGSAKKEACTTTGLPGPFRCSGTGSCDLWVLTQKGTKLSWTSTCGGTYETVVGDGGGTLTFSCK